ncbi:MAG: peroxiredoxin family protein, partial [Armatimonadota bacterium]
MRTRLLLLALGLLGATAGVVYLAVTLSSPPRVKTSEEAVPPPIRPITTPGSIITTGPREGSRAPSFAAPRFDGGTLSLSDLRGKGVVMNFFASWCAPCRAEARDLEATFQKHRNKGIVFL